MQLNFPAIACVVVVAGIVLFASAMSADLSVKPAKYDTIKSKIDAGQEGILYSYDPVKGIATVTWRISDFNLSQFDYYGRVYSNHHTDIVFEKQLTAATGSISIPLAKVESGTYWINLQKYRDKGTDEDGDLLDMIRIDIGTPSRDGDAYEQQVSGYIKRAQSSEKPISAKGAAWTSR